MEVERWEFNVVCLVRWISSVEASLNLALGAIDDISCYGPPAGGGNRSGYKTNKCEHMQIFVLQCCRTYI